MEAQKEKSIINVICINTHKNSKTARRANLPAACNFKISSIASLPFLQERCLLG